ncbi:MAG: hypothetical protein ACYTGH_22025 [Planctomycetota bacterium]
MKLKGTSGLQLLERKRVEEVILAHPNPNHHLLGVDYIITGGVQLLGPWEKASSGLRVNVKVLSAATAGLKGDASHIVDGKAGELFDLEAEVASRCAGSLGVEATQAQIGYRDAHSRPAKKLLAEGVMALLEAQGKSDLGAKRKALEKAIELLRSAQMVNEGHYFTAAHTHEARARELLALAQADDEKAKAVRFKTVELFRKDAVAASPALYNLGRALQNNGRYEEAIDTYGDYLTWMAAEKKATRWSQSLKPITFTGYKDDNLWPHRLGYRSYVAYRKRLYAFEERGTEKMHLICIDSVSGERLWRSERPLGRPTRQDSG